MTGSATPRKPAKPRHGTERRYRDGCHCDRCREAHNAYRRRERDRARQRAGKPPRGRVTTDHTDTTDSDHTTEPDHGPIETAARLALPKLGGDDDLAELRRQLAYGAARVADTRPAQFRNAAESLRAILSDLIIAKPPTDAEAQQLAAIMGGFSARGRR